MHEPGYPGRGLALLAGLLTVAAVVGAALVAAPFDLGDPEGPARFEAADDGSTDPLCQPEPDGTRESPIYSAQGDQRALTLRVTCSSGSLRDAQVLLETAAGDARALYTVEADDGVVAVTGPTGERRQLEVATADLQVRDPDDGSDPTTDVGAGDLPPGAQSLFRLVDGGDAPADATTVLQFIEVSDDGGIVIHLPASATADESGASVTVVGPDGKATTVDTRDHVDLQDLLGGKELPVSKGTVTDAAGDVLAVLEGLSPGGDPASMAYGTARSTYGTATSAAFALAPTRVAIYDAQGDKVAEVKLPGEETAPSLPGAEVLEVGSTCTEVTGSLELVHQGTCSGDVDEVRVPSAPGAGDVTAAVTLRRSEDGGWTLTAGGQSHPVPGQTVHIPSTPADPALAHVVELQDGDGNSVTEVQVKKKGAGLVHNVTEVDVVRKVENATGDVKENVTTLVSDFLVVEKNLTASAVNATVFPGAEPGPGDLVVRKSGGEWVVETPFSTTKVTGAELTVAPSATDRQTVHVLLRDENGETLARFDVTARDDAPGSAKATYDIPAAGEEGSGSVSPPVAVLGSPTDPKGVRVTGPQGETLLLYEEGSGDEATVSIPPADATQTVHKETLRIEGNPLVDDEWTLVVEDASDDTVHRYTVNRPNWREAARETARKADAKAPADLGPVVSAVDTAASTAPSAEDEADFLGGVSDGSVTLESEGKLAGQRWLSGLRNLTFEAVFDDPAAYNRFYVRYSAEKPVPLDARTVALTPVDGNASHRRGTVDLAKPGSWDGETLYFEVVAERRAGDGFFAYARVDNRTDAPFAVRVDGARPTASVTAPSNPDGPTWLVNWDGEDAASGVVEFQVQKQVAGGPWKTLLDRTSGRSVQFDGQADLTYRFRVRATDGVGHTSPWTDPPAEVIYDSPDGGTGGSGNVTDGSGGTSGNKAPSVSLLSPSSGQEVSGIVEVRWSANDPDGTAPAVNAYVRPADESTWSPLRTNSDRAYWDTAEWTNGEYEIKVVADDGTLQSKATVAGVTVANEKPASGDATDPASPGTSGGSGGGSDGGTGGNQAPGGSSGTQNESGSSGGGTKGGGIPGPGALAVAVAAGVAALAARRRRR